MFDDIQRIIDAAKSGVAEADLSEVIGHQLIGLTPQLAAHFIMCIRTKAESISDHQQKAALLKALSAHSRE